MFVQLVVEDLKEKTIWNHICVLIEIGKEHSTSLNNHYNRKGIKLYERNMTPLVFGLEFRKSFAVVYVDDSESVVEWDLF